MSIPLLITTQGYLLKKDDFSTIVTTKDKGKYAELSYQKLDYNKKENRVGYVFRNRFRMEGIDSNNYIFNCILYI